MQGGEHGTSPHRGARAKDPRAAMQEKLRETRARLSQGTTLKPEFEYELLSMFVRNELSARVTIPLLAVIFSLASMFWAPVLQASAWLAAVISVKFFMIAACRRFLGQPRTEIHVGRWRRLFIWLELASGIAWGGMAVLGVGATDAASHVFMLAALIVLLAIRMTFASAVMSILYVGTVPMTVAVVTRLLLQWHPFYLAMAAMAVGMHIYFIFLAKGLNTTALAMLEFRAEKDALIAEVEEEKAISDEARRRAEAANVAKSRFLATMSHELRTPLNAILGFSEVMKGELLGPMQNASYKDYAGNIHESGRHLLQLINEILDLSRIEAGRYELNQESLRLCDVLEDCLRLLHLRAESKGLHVALDFAKDLDPLWADERAVRQICLNLLSNAIKFTPRGGRITLRAASTPDGGQTLIVKDTGPGIPKEEIPRVMQAFGQGSLAHETAEGGTGLGLPIVQNLVALHGGTFELRSELRKGTEAVVEFPRSRVLRAMPPLQPLGQERHRQAVALAGRRAHTEPVTTAR
ncbi:MAG TPA: ATP-binding protein [Hyphomicrobiaceae bacterium]|jgi:two-component system cell cycle sensor histidine kinase PleC|nr:ATP-binding protein [Hyphomicrobiaceae bacterium]